MNFKENMTKEELSSYYENRLITNYKKIDIIINRFNR